VKGLVSMTDVIRIERLNKTFGPKVALNDVSMRVPTGSVVGLLGPNGAGKTTLINCLTTLLTPDSGTAYVAGHEVTADPKAVRGSVAVAGQFAALDMMMTGRENLVFFGRLLRLSRRAAAVRADELLHQFDLMDAADQLSAMYSGGMHRRLDLAVSLIMPRPVLVLDEPTTGLDPRSREVLWNMVRELAAGGMAILLTTQYLEEADALADRIVVIDDGRVIAEGTPAELKSKVGGSVITVRIADERVRLHAAGILADLTSAGTTGGDAAEVVVPVRRTGDLADIVRRLDAGGVSADDIEVHRPTLNDVFFALTRRTDEASGPAEARSTDQAKAAERV
jgi:ABC-2 type transport system ATP-binding protein